MKQLNFNKININWLGFLRISIALFAIIHFAAIQKDFDNFFSYTGYVQPDIMSASHDTISPTIIDVHNFVLKYNKGISYESVLTFFRFGYFIFLTLLAVGFCTRFSAVLSLLTQIVLLKSIHYFQYGADFFTTILLFYCVIFPVGKVFSLDNRILKRKIVEINHHKFLRLFQIHICIVYFVSGIDKLLGFNWRNGEALWKSITDHNMTGLFHLDFLKHTSFFLIAGWATIIIELLYPLFINIKKIRFFWLLLVIGLHLSIAVFIGLFFFSTIMILFNLTAYYIPYLKEIKYEEQHIKSNRFSIHFLKIKSIDFRKMLRYE
jgi:hypothetical protein